MDALIDNPVFGLCVACTAMALLLSVIGVMMWSWAGSTDQASVSSRAQETFFMTRRFAELSPAAREVVRGSRLGGAMFPTKSAAAVLLVPIMPNEGQTRMRAGRSRAGMPRS